MTAPLLELRGLTKSYGAGLPPVLNGLSLSMGAGELVTLLGPSGCGKTTTLRLIAGLDTPDAGEVHIGGRDVTRLSPERRGVGLVFQDYALFPHLNVLDNVRFGLRHLPKAEQLPRAHDTLALVGLTVFETRMPHQLSGGQQQRVALARALAARPPLLLLDEPFSNLDAALRHSTRAEVRQILRDSGTAALLVTHDQAEALAFSDRLVVMRSGQIEQSGPPHDVYTRPRTTFTAGFLGRANLLSARIEGGAALTPLGRLSLGGRADGPVMLCMRPEALELTPAGLMGGVGRVLSREYLGGSVSYVVALEDASGWPDLLVTESLGAAGGRLWAEGERVCVGLRGAVHVLE